jgi:hypothetical protein
MDIQKIKKNAAIIAGSLLLLIGSGFLIWSALKSSSPNDKTDNSQGIEVYNSQGEKKLAGEFQKILNSPEYVEIPKKPLEFVTEGENRKNFFLVIKFNSPKHKDFIIHFTRNNSDGSMKQIHYGRFNFSDEDWEQVTELIEKKNEEKRMKNMKKKISLSKKLEDLDLYIRDSGREVDEKGWVLFSSLQNSLLSVTSVNPNHPGLKSLPNQQEIIGIFKIKTSVPSVTKNHHELQYSVREIDVEQDLTIEPYSDDFDF